LGETKYTVIALQMLPHAVGHGRRRQKNAGTLYMIYNVPALK
jgi:hypothetical protein